VSLSDNYCSFLKCPTSAPVNMAPEVPKHIENCFYNYSITLVPKYFEMMVCKRRTKLSLLNKGGLFSEYFCIIISENSSEVICLDIKLLFGNRISSEIIH
jgi:hypothetical protein